jgi:hypothetical protein
VAHHISSTYEFFEKGYRPNEPDPAKLIAVSKKNGRPQGSSRGAIISRAELISPLMFWKTSLASARPTVERNPAGFSQGEWNFAPFRVTVAE